MANSGNYDSRMLGNYGSSSAGWYHAEGDPSGTQRYWNGDAWVGEPQVFAPVSPEPPYNGQQQQQRPPQEILAPFGSRVAAAILDLLAWLVPTMAGAWADWSLASRSGELIASMAYLVAFVVVILNYVVRQGRTGQTVGKSMLGLKLVQNASGKPPGLGKSVLRVCLFLGFFQFCCGIVGVIDLLRPAWDGNNERITDKILKLSVIRG